MSVLRDKGGRVIAERLNWTLFDSFTLLNAGAAPAVGAVWTLFQVPQGTAGSGFALAKTARETNMTQAGMLPANHSFEIRSIQVACIVGLLSVIADVRNFLANTDFVLRVVNKNVLEVPTGIIPGGNSLVDVSSAGGAAAVPANGWPIAANTYRLREEPIVLEPVQTFSVVVTNRILWTAAPTDPFVFRVSLNGILTRPTQ